MDAALELPRMRSARNLYLDVWNENSRALRFYTRYGFHEAGACDVVVDSRVIGKDLIMRLCLPAVLPRRRFSAEPSQGQK